MYSAALLLGSGLLAAALPQGVEKALPKGVFSLPLHPIRNGKAYGLDLEVGTPSQKVTCLLDTGSNTYSFESPTDDVCKRGFCKEFGSYNNLSSTTAKFYKSGFNNVVSDKGYGDEISDVVTVNGQALSGMTFGYVLEHYVFPKVDYQIVPICGLSVLCNPDSCNGSTSLTQALWAAGHIPKRAFSVYLGSGDASSTPTLLLGGVDKAKQGSKVYKLPLVSDKGDYYVPGKIVTLGVSLQQSGAPAVNYTYDEPQPVLWDTGSVAWNMPKPLFDAAAAYFGLKDASGAPTQTGYEVDCKYRTPGANGDGKIVVSFEQGASVAVPMWTMPVAAGGKCYVEMAASSGQWGATFLKSVYFTWDLEEMTVAFSQARYTEETDIVAIQ